jgi:Rieske Fe-S protein
VAVLCPHEHCDVDFVSDPSKLPAEVLAEIGRTPTEPVYVCPCHNSTFRATDGERLAGPAPRGLYRFRVTAVSDASVEIAEVEEDVLLFTEI